MIPSCHDIDDPTDSSDLDDDEQIEIGLVDDTDYGDGPGYPSPCLPGARDLARMLIPNLLQEVTNG